MRRCRCRRAAGCRPRLLAIPPFKSTRARAIGARMSAFSGWACLVAFDLLNLNGEDIRHRPLEERRAAFSPLVAGVDGILFSDALVADGALVFAKACELGREGIVSKRAGSRYLSRQQPAVGEVEEPGLREDVTDASRRRAHPVRRARPGAVDRLRAVRRDLPMPGSPTMSKTWMSGPIASKPSSSFSSSRSRPT